MYLQEYPVSRKEAFMPKVLGFMTLHYGGDYLKEALLSVVDHVDKFVVAYSYGPSQGHSNNTPCPDKRDDLLSICQDVLEDKLHWVEQSEWPNEASHRSVKYDHAAGYDIILTVDADEVMIGLPEAFAYALANKERHYGINGYYNFFRSFSWVCTDGFRPCRIEVMNRNNTLQNLECPLTILHFSCAQRREIMEYKYQNFGHASEIRPNYLQDVFYKWTPNEDVKWLHAVSLQIWEKAVPYDKTTMPEYLKQHPNYNLDIIP
jgi:hypothetical protein